MTDFSDTEADFNPTDPADLAILNMDLASTDTRVAEWLAHCGGDPVKAFSYDWLSVNSDILWLKRKLHANFDDHAPSLLKVVDSIDTWTIDADTIQDWTQKTKDFWVDMPTGNIGITKLFYYVMVGTAAVYSHQAMMDSSFPVLWYGSSARPELSYCP